MPIYEYDCPKCGIIEEWHSMKEKLDKCPTCGEPIERVISGGAGFRFVGVGWGSPWKSYKGEDA